MLFVFELPSVQRSDVSCLHRVFPGLFFCVIFLSISPHASLVLPRPGKGGLAHVATFVALFLFLLGHLRLPVADDVLKPPAMLDTLQELLDQWS